VVGPARRRPRPIVACEVGRLLFLASLSLTDGARLSVLSSPPPRYPSAPRRVSSPTDCPSSSRPPVDCLRHLDVHLSLCRREPLHHPRAVERRVDADRCTAAGHCCSSRDARVRSSMTRPCAACPTGRAGTAESAPSSLRHSPADARAWPHGQGALAPLIASRGHLDAPPV
jgi:hypothetical protein